jgi:hypothetical protein
MHHLELFVKFMQTSISPQAPSGFPRHCLGENDYVPGKPLVRYHIWRNGIIAGDGKEIKCLTQTYRHSICIFGAEDVPTLM